MLWVWTWSGKYFGYINNSNLFTYSGKQVGKFYGTEVYGSDGRYLGELRDKNRLIHKIRKKFIMKSGFTPMAGTCYAKYADYAGYAMPAGYEDFLSPEIIN